MAKAETIEDLLAQKTWLRVVVWCICVVWFIGWIYPIFVFYEFKMWKNGVSLVIAAAVFYLLPLCHWVIFKRFPRCIRSFERKLSYYFRAAVAILVLPWAFGMFTVIGVGTFYTHYFGVDSEERGRVQDKYFRTSYRSGTHYYLELPNRKIQVSPALYQYASLGDEVRFTERSSLFGHYVDEEKLKLVKKSAK